MRSAGSVDPWHTYLGRALQDLRLKGHYRQLSSLQAPASTRLIIDGRPYLNFSSNDYLGLSTDPRLKEAASAAIKNWGTGCGASRLVSGNIELYERLERTVSGFKGTEGSLVFSSGYAANSGVLSALAQPEDLILSDRLNHASIVDGSRLSKARVHVYPHCDVQYVERLLRTRKSGGKVLLVTDGVFSMDGNVAPLAELYAVCRDWGALLMVDDAHATGVLGPNGKGTLDHFGVEAPEMLQMGTFSKALGSLGGFAAGSALFVDYLLNHARSLIYSTALPPPILAASEAAVRIVETEPGRRDKLRTLGRRLREGLRSLGIASPDGVTPIIPVVIGGADQTVALSSYLWKQSIFIPAIRPPTVPFGGSRVRVSLSALHEMEDVDRLLDVLKMYFRKGS